MNLFRLFRKPNLECPRCLGKGSVDWEDIRRLNRQLKWQPGKCAYCNGFGKVFKETLDKVPFDNAYLTVSLSPLERQKLQEGNDEMLVLSRAYELFIDHLINYVEHQYLVEKMDADRIADLYLSKVDRSDIFSIERNDLLIYIEKIIDLKRSEMN